MADGTANLIPAKPGEVRNPNGRPVGSKNRATVLRQIADLQLKRDDLDGKQIEASAEDFAMMALFRKAMEGDVAAVKEINDTLYGKVTDKQEMTGKDGKELFPSAIAVNVVRPDLIGDTIGCPPELGQPKEGE